MGFPTYLVRLKPEDDILPVEKILSSLGVDVLVDEVVSIDPKGKSLTTRE